MVNLRDDPAAIDAYRRYHLEVWPEVLRSLRQVGVQEMEIHLLGRRAVMIVDMADGLDYHEALAAHTASNSRVAEWERLMRDLQEPAESASGEERWVLMQAVFRMNEQEPAIARVAQPLRAS